VFTDLFGRRWMGEGEAYDRTPTDTQLAELHEHLAQYGGVFDGDPFCLFVQSLAPAARTVAVVSCEPSVYEASSGKPTGITIEGIEVGDDVVLRIKLLFFDNPQEPAVFAPILNPTETSAREMISALATQPAWEFMFLDSANGSPVGTRFVPIQHDQRQGLRQILKMTAGRPELSPDRWQEVASPLRLR